jgi:ribosomal protein S18 acetylase RimI-like enzyme
MARRTSTRRTAPWCASVHRAFGNRHDDSVDVHTRFSHFRVHSWGCGSPCRCDSVGLVSLSTPLPAGVTVRGADDADSPAMALLAATSFGSFRAPESTDMWRSMMPADGAVAVCDGAEIVGMSMYLDLRLTVPGGAVLRAAGATWVAVSPTHRRRGILRAMLDELHRRITCTSIQLPRCWPVKAASSPGATA